MTEYIYKVFKDSGSVESELSSKWKLFFKLKYTVFILKIEGE